MSNASSNNRRETTKKIGLHLRLCQQCTLGLLPIGCSELLVAAILTLPVQSESTPPDINEIRCRKRDFQVLCVAMVGLLRGPLTSSLGHSSKGQIKKCFDGESKVTLQVIHWLAKRVGFKRLLLQLRCCAVLCPVALTGNRKARDPRNQTVTQRWARADNLHSELSASGFRRSRVWKQARRRAETGRMSPW